ncbi:UNVERIFIED_CONTAM: hypothetical protein GTU68_010978 [Idotea baltica]|nr:hypothetical protein [Idotea baltica]
MNAVIESGAVLLPIDSEHNAIFQCLPTHGSAKTDTKGVHKIVLTASGGPFRLIPLEQLSQVTPEQACSHPNWSMGKKISVDSATMLNKGLELIEACWLFDVNPEQVDIVVHPQSVIHSMVSYKDGSTLAQMGYPDMRIPIAHALSWPERINSGVESLDLLTLDALTFEEPDEKKFPCLKLSRQAALTGGAAPVILNAANEVAVHGFLNKKLSFLSISQLIDAVLDTSDFATVTCLDDVLLADKQARIDAMFWMKKNGHDA